LPQNGTGSGSEAVSEATTVQEEGTVMPIVEPARARGHSGFGAGVGSGGGGVGVVGVVVVVMVVVVVVPELVVPDPEVEPLPPLPGQRTRLLRAAFLALVFVLALVHLPALALAVGAPEESAAGRAISMAPQARSAAVRRIPLFRVATDMHAPHRPHDGGTEYRVVRLDGCS
jgi:hypothetical protein